MPKITKMYAFIAENEGPDDEGVVGMSSGQWLLPLVGADMDRVNSLRHHARAIARKTGKKIKLVRFTHRQVLEELK